MWVKRASLASGGIALFAMTGSGWAATLAADYQLNDVYTSSVGTIGPLVPLGSTIGFDSATVNGQSRDVLAINAGPAGSSTSVPPPTPSAATSGVQAQTNGYVSSTNYSVVLTAAFTLTPDLVATKVFDFKNLSADAGLYLNDATGLLSFNGAATPPPIGGTPVIAGNYTQVALTRNSSGLVSVYQNGVLAFSFDDSTSQLAVLGDATNTGNAFLTLFKDDNADVEGGVLDDETSAGYVADVQLYDGALTASQITALVPEPTSVAILCGAITLVMRRRPPTRT